MSGDGEMMPDYIGLAADIVSAFVSNNSVPPVELPALIASVHATLERLTAPVSEEKAEPLQPAVSIKRSITPDFLVCLEDGKKFKSLKRHLRTRYDMTPDQYRAKWNLPSDYPMVAPNYAAARSELAKNMGLGQQRRKQAAAAVVTEPKAPAPRGRRPRVTADA
ncbi:MAG: MucR family transcriptional regulator [Methylobacterium sp.]|jgi:predicted transcriptional regulator|uniref:MucR family transcriptional regulator n=1 Tax=unclassified Methylobacterium TaxID=2615210 RepID=UPI0006F8D2FA|nr:MULTISPECIES: MucR family transcriptional regulator [unclassified Methylobacterium]KQP10479.1 transcriptional regulator [Methylobacterium sp. Leaf99]MDO9427456.1 MucR family transcriptional regulator [Methylobacterium sp.]TXM68928.1 transcriptional regulator [Methylobacterium sp. WL69]